MKITRESAKRCVGDGWSKLIDKIYDRLVDGDVVLQVKEKFGGLRFYLFSGNDETYDFIDEVEKESLTICELCGESGSLVSIKGWYKTLCKKCKDEIERKF